MRFLFLCALFCFSSVGYSQKDLELELPSEYSVALQIAALDQILLESPDEVDFKVLLPVARQLFQSLKDHPTWATVEAESFIYRILSEKEKPGYKKFTSLAVGHALADRGRSSDRIRTVILDRALAGEFPATYPPTIVRAIWWNYFRCLAKVNIPEIEAEPIFPYKSERMRRPLRQVYESKEYENDPNIKRIAATAWIFSQFLERDQATVKAKYLTTIDRKRIDGATDVFLPTFSSQNADEGRSVKLSEGK